MVRHVADPTRPGIAVAVDSLPVIGDDSPKRAADGDALSRSRLLTAAARAEVEFLARLLDQPLNRFWFHVEPRLRPNGGHLTDQLRRQAAVAVRG